MAEPLVYAFTNTGVFDSFDGINYQINTTATVNAQFFGNAVFINSSTILLGNTSVFNTVNSTVWTGQTNVVSNNTSDWWGNSSVNAAVNGTSFEIGNTTVNTTINSTAVLVGNSKTEVSINSSAIFIGNSISNITITTSFSSSNNNSFWWGNSTSNAFVNGTIFVIGNSSVNTTISSNSYFGGTVSTAAANILSQTITYASALSWNTALGQVATVTLTGNATFNAPTNLKVGTYILHIIQDTSGSRFITSWNSVFKWPAATAPVLTTAINSHDVISFISDGTNLYGSFLPDVR